MVIEIIIVCIIRVTPIDNGCFIMIIDIDKIKFMEIIYIISGNSLFKILILEIKDRIFSFSDVLRGELFYSLQDYYFV